jgi:hypothetical protein
MTPSDIWTLVGLSFATLGAVLLAYDVVYGAGNRFQASVLKRQLETLRSTRKYARDIIGRLPQPPWTVAEIQEELDREEKEWGPQEVKLAQEASKVPKHYEARVVTLGAWGVLLIVGGFLLQIVGLIVHALAA